MKKYIGCSGFHYEDWQKKFYPEDLPSEKWLEYYADRFNTVEINNTFYNMPTTDDLKKWRDQTPDGFKFTVKGNRFFTHMKKLNMDSDFTVSLSKFQDTVHTLNSKLGCILWQLPGNLHKDVKKLDSFSEALDMSINHVFEFRHESWFTKKIFNLLEDNELAYCILSAPEGLPDKVKATAKTAYARFHGKTEWYDYHYDDDELKNWKERLDNLEGVDELYVYFNNDPNAWSVENAGKLKDLFGE